MRRKKVWRTYPEQQDLIGELSARHGLPPLISRILLNRGLCGEEDVLAFLDPALERLHPPFGLPDLEAAAARLGEAVRRGEPVGIYGDYDVDGLTSTCLLQHFLQELGGQCLPYIPDRLQEGSGRAGERRRDDVRLQDALELSVYVAGALGHLAGWGLRDVVATRDELDALQAGLLVSHEAPRGRDHFDDWLSENGETVGRTYASELARNFRGQN